MTVRSARGVVFQGLSMLATVCVAGCGAGRADGHQVPGGDAAAVPPEVEGAGGGGDYVPTEAREKTAEAGTARRGVTGDAGSTSDAARPSVDAGSPEASAPPCVPEAGADEPDEDFVDSNCDGIDGDASAAVFVASSGDDTAAGSMDAPFATVKHAISVAIAAGKSVYLCNASYPESIELSGAGVNVYGGYACDRGWRRELDRATLEPPSGIPFVAKSVTTPMVVDRVTFKAPDAKGPGESSIAASVVGSAQIRFVRVRLVAGTGQDGKAGSPVYDPRQPPAQQAAALDAIPLAQADYCVTNSPGSPDWYGDPDCVHVSDGAVDGPRKCEDGSKIVGGEGGYGGNFYWGIPFGEAGSPGVPAASGRDGDTGAVGDFGAGASSDFGKITDGVYVATNNGRDGGYGRPGESGQGGDGGSGVTGNGSPVTTYAPGGGGGQGGYGGCGGRGGKKGYGGGASLALVAVDSGVSVEWSTVETGRAGKGGDGSDGASGDGGGVGGKGAPSGAAFRGGHGGRGGDGGSGGSGGPGGGGPSVGIVWIGKAPATSNVAFELGSPGLGGTSTSGANAENGLGAETYSPAEAGTAGK